MALALDDNTLLDAVKNSATEHTISWAKETPCTDDQVFCEHNGVITSYIAERLGLEINATRRALDKLVKRGLLCKSKNNSGSYCQWWPVGHLAALKASPDTPALTTLLGFVIAMETEAQKESAKPLLSAISDEFKEKCLSPHDEAGRHVLQRISLHHTMAHNSDKKDSHDQQFQIHVEQSPDQRIVLVLHPFHLPYEILRKYLLEQNEIIEQKELAQPANPLIH
jgi:hypothetical protein